MDLKAIYRLSIYAMIYVSALMLCFSEGAPLPQGLTFVIAAVAYQLTDKRGSFALSPVWSNVFGVTAFVLTVAEIIYGEMANAVDRRILAGAHLLVYLSWVVMLQKKELRHYWWLTALSVLQVAVGAVLTRAGWYGAMLFSYFFLAIWTLSVFSLYQASLLFARRKPDGSVEGSTVALAAQPTGMVKLYNQSSQSISVLQMDGDERWVTSRFSGGTVLTALGSIFIGAIFFVLIPRVWIGRAPFANDNEVEAGRVLTGFTDEVQLGDFGQILESTRQVMQVRVYDGDEEMDVFEYARALGYEEPMFRGTSLALYNKGRWRQGNQAGNFQRLPSKSEQSIRQQIRLEPIGVRFLFAMHPVLAAKHRSGQQVVSHSTSSTVVIAGSSSAPKKAMEYTVFSPRNAASGEQVIQTARMREGYVLRRTYLDLPPSGIDRLQELAKSVAGSNTEDSDLTRARKLEAYLRDSGEFSYTLDMSITDPSIDPVEDFLFNRKKGHCEYFASALTLMLRSAGIPSRLVSGFKGGVENSLTGVYEVQQRHAHAWVEGWVDDRWVVFDPTPAGRGEDVASYTPTLKTWADFRQFVSSLWSQHILDMTLQNQYRTIYDPLLDAGKSWFASWNKEGEEGSLWESIKAFASSPENWFSWQGGIVTFILLFLGVFLVWLSRRLIRWLQEVSGRWNQKLSARQLRVAFYEQFREICEQHGVKRSPWTSYREYAQIVTSELRPALEPAGLVDTPGLIVERFLEIRFGDQDLPSEIRDELNTEIDRLRDCLKEDEIGVTSLAAPSPQRGGPASIG